MVVYRIARVFDFINKAHADICNDDRLSILAAARQELDRMDYLETLALRDAAIALQTMVETRLLALQAAEK